MLTKSSNTALVVANPYQFGKKPLLSTGNIQVEAVLGAVGSLAAIAWLGTVFAAAPVIYWVANNILAAGHSEPEKKEPEPPVYEDFERPLDVEYEAVEEVEDEDYRIPEAPVSMDFVRDRIKTAMGTVTPPPEPPTRIKMDIPSPVETPKIEVPKATVEPPKPAIETPKPVVIETPKAKTQEEIEADYISKLVAIALAHFDKTGSDEALLSAIKANHRGLKEASPEQWEAITTLYKKASEQELIVWSESARGAITLARVSVSESVQEGVNTLLSSLAL